MTTVAEIVRGVAALLLLSACLDLLLPAGELAKFSRLALGLLLITLIMEPLSSVWQTWRSNPDIPWPQEVETAVSASFLQQGEELAVFLQGEAYDRYVNQLSRQIEAVACLNESVEQAQAWPEIDLQSGALTSLRLNVVLKDGADLQQDKLLTSLSGFFAVDKQNIMISEATTYDGR